ncbi:hypothetical protein JC794_18325 [Morganella morganii]|nr:hypothetical protein [Morganella morganii]QXO46041.1 hypothetical protein JC862_17440 [Morganella morganii]QXO53579.1 hypothetical protein JC830_18270 [Morganella morganii]QXO68714.1 hypothetical protein JC792_17335 [Morganella morganii]QXO76369.1 hypothetical protein JC794_18325 [Morganella morganii]QXO80217.1 hypothetical protein JA116_17905 [Morganella morganii]
MSINNYYNLSSGISAAENKIGSKEYETLDMVASDVSGVIVDSSILTFFL